MSRRTLSWAFVALSLTLMGGMPTIEAPRGPQSAAAETRPAPTAIDTDPSDDNTQQLPPPITPELREVRAVTYTFESPIVWPRDAKRRQVILVAGARAGDYYAWMVADGTRVGSVFFLQGQPDVDNLVLRLGRTLVATTASSPLDQQSWGIAGTIVIPDPPPQGPGGFPELYIQRVMNTAWYLDRSATQATLPVYRSP